LTVVAHGPKGFAMDLGLQGRWALVCGASRGLGLGCARALAAEGVNLLMVARRPDVLAQSAAEIRAQKSENTGAEVQFLPADVTTAEGRESIWARRRDFDIVITNAGGPPPGDFRQWDSAAWQAALQANMLAPIELIRATVDGMAERGFGRVVNITSSAVKAPIAVLGLSNGARSGLTGFVAGLARSDLSARGVTLNNLLPGAFDTDRLQAVMAGVAQKTGQPLDAVARQRRAGIPMQRFGTADEFGAVCAFLCSAQAGYITGQNILLDGGAYPGTF